MTKEWSRLEDIDSNEPDGTSAKDIAGLATHPRRTKLPITRRKPATSTKMNTKRGSAPSPEPAPPGQTLSARPTQSRNSRGPRDTATSSLQMQQKLREGTLEQSDLMPEHVHFDYPGKDWVDKSQPPREAITRPSGSPGAWVCPKAHAWGRYINASNKKSCGGCGDKNREGERVSWDLVKGYVIDDAEKDSLYTFKVCFTEKDKSSAFLEGRHQNSHAGRMRIFLKRMFPAATEKELRAYWSRPFEWTDNGKIQARDMMQHISSDVQAGKWSYRSLQGMTPQNGAAAGAPDSSAHGVDSSQIQDKALGATEEASDLGDTTVYFNDQASEQDMLPIAASEFLNEGPDQESPRTAPEEDSDINRTNSIDPKTSWEEPPYALVHEASMGGSSTDPGSEDLSPNDPQFYRLLFNVIKDLSSAEHASLRQHITSVCAFPAWNTMAHVPDDKLFRRLVGFFS